MHIKGFGKVLWLKNLSRGDVTPIGQQRISAITWFIYLTIASLEPRFHLLLVHMFVLGLSVNRVFFNRKSVFNASK